MVAAALLGVWTNVYMISGRDIDTERSNETLGLLLATPTPLVVVILGKVAINAAVGLLAIATALVVGLAFGQVVIVPDVRLIPLAMAFFVVVIIQGVLLATVFTVSRMGSGYANGIELLIWLICGVILPLDALPQPLVWAGLTLPLTWISGGILSAATGNTATAHTLVLAITALLALCYAALAVELFRLIDARIRRLGSLHG